MASYNIPFWKDAPFIRLVIPFIAGIIAARYLPAPENVYLYAIGVGAVCQIAFFVLALKWQYFLRICQGVVLNLLLFSLGGFCSCINSPFRSAGLIEKYPDTKSYFATLEEPVVERKSTFKTLASLINIQQDSTSFNPATNILVYFKKADNVSIPRYGYTIAFTRRPQPIENFAKGFDYKEYCALKNIHYQVTLDRDDFVVVDTSSGNVLVKFIFNCQAWVIATLQRYVPGKRECGLAEALLIGYKNDLDRSLIRSYSNTGVVHVVAISGLHLGLIYGMLNFFCRPLNLRRTTKAGRAIIVLTGLWMFTLLAGASPSVLRSAVMFSFIVFGDSFTKKTSLLNSLSASAFMLLCYNPYWLWDLGFVLSYGALLSIMIFQQPLYRLFLCDNKLIDNFWKLNTVTLAAQVLTLPVLIYYFKQFPNLFLVTNLIAIPLSSLILLGELMLCAVSFFPSIALLIGKAIAIAIKVMNAVVEYMDSFSFSSTKGLNISFIQLIIFYVFIAFMSQWLIAKHKQGLSHALISLIVFFLVVLHPFEAPR